MKNRAGGGMDYLQACRTSLSQFGFSPDAEFPIINGKETSLSTFILKWQHQELPIFIALQVAFIENMVPESADCSRFLVPTLDLAGLLDALPGTPAQVWNLNDEETTLQCQICCKIQLLKMELMVRPTWLLV